MLPLGVIVCFHFHLLSSKIEKKKVDGRRETEAEEEQIARHMQMTLTSRRPTKVTVGLIDVLFRQPGAHRLKVGVDPSSRKKRQHRLVPTLTEMSGIPRSHGIPHLYDLCRVYSAPYLPRGVGVLSGLCGKIKTSVVSQDILSLSRFFRESAALRRN